MYGIRNVLFVDLLCSPSHFDGATLPSLNPGLLPPHAKCSLRLRLRALASDLAGVLLAQALLQPAAQPHGVDVVEHYRRARLHASGRRQMRGICAAHVQLLRIRPRSSRGSSSQAPVPATPCTRRVRAVCRDTHSPFRLKLVPTRATPRESRGLRAHLQSMEGLHTSLPGRNS